MLSTQQTLSIYSSDKQNKLISGQINGEACTSHWKKSIAFEKAFYGAMWSLDICTCEEYKFQQIAIKGHCHRSVRSKFWDRDLQAETSLGKDLRNNTWMGVKEAGLGRRRRVGLRCSSNQGFNQPLWALGLLVRVVLNWTSVSALYTTASTSYWMWAAFRKVSWPWTKQLSWA